MAWTKPTFYFSLIFVVAIIFTSLALVGDALLSHDRITLNADSLDYIATVKGVSSSSGFEEMSTTTSADSASTGILAGDDNASVGTDTDYLGATNLKKERASKPTNFLRIAYNIPSTMIISLGLPIDNFKHIINIISFVLVVALIVLVWTKFINV